LKNLYEEEKKKYSSTKEYKTIDFKDRKEFYSYIRQYKDVENPPNITQV